jgi:hypothetical protein
MHFIKRNVNEPTRDFAYWRDQVLGVLGAICILGGGVRFFDWLKDRKPIDGEWGLGFLVAYGLLALLSPKRLKYIFYSLLAIVAWGILGAISHLTLLGLPIILLCAFLAYLLLRWKGHLLK